MAGDAEISAALARAILNAIGKEEQVKESQAEKKRVLEQKLCLAVEWNTLSVLVSAP